MHLRCRGKGVTVKAEVDWTVLEEGGLDAAEGEDGLVGGLPQLHRAGVDSWSEKRENAIHWHRCAQKYTC